MVARGFLAPVDLAEGLRRALQEQIHAAVGAALFGDQLAGAAVAQLGVLRELGEVLVVDPLEQVDPPQLGDASGGSCAVARYSWIRDTAIEPSPTALATRLIERDAHVAGDEHARRARLQRVGVALERPAVVAHLRPGEDEAPLIAREHALQPVRARRRADEDEAGVDVLARDLAVGRRGYRGSSAGRPRRARRPPRCPCAPRCWPARRSARSGSETSTSPASCATSIETRLAYPLKYTAACPAEFAPPITTTCWSAQERASVSAAP